MRIILLFFSLCVFHPSIGQKKTSPRAKISKAKRAKPTTQRVIYGLASFYHNKFHGRRTASGEVFSQKKLTCASNMFPLGTWVKVTNVRNGNWVVVKVNDRMHTRMHRIADLSSAAEKKLGYASSGMVRVKVEVLSNKKSA